MGRPLPKRIKMTMTEAKIASILEESDIRARHIASMFQLIVNSLAMPHLDNTGINCSFDNGNCCWQCATLEAMRHVSGELEGPDGKPLIHLPGWVQAEPASHTERDVGTYGHTPMREVAYGTICIWEYENGKIRIFKSHTPSDFIVIQPADRADLLRALRQMEENP
jgi:hypothetical protein